MTRANWGSVTGDLSGLFSDLIEDFQRTAEAAANRQIRRSEEEQAAEDSEMYDKWNNGLVSDEEWLEYVRQRVKDTKGDPDQHQQWLETFRNHRSAIQDAQIEADYESGAISIHKLIAHYAGRMNKTEEDSPKYREWQSRYYNLVDTRDADYIEDRAAQIEAQINRGQAGYKDLLNFYKSMLGKVRRSSPLYNQLERNIRSISDIAAGVTGGRSGGSGGSGGSGSGSGGNEYMKASRAVLRQWKSGSVFVPRGPDVISSVLDEYNIDLRDDTAVWNALAEDSVVIEQLMDFAQKNPDAPYLVTPWGDQIPNTLEMRHMLMNQALRGYDYRIALGNASGRSVVGVMSARKTFVDSTFGAENSMKASDYWRQSRQDAWEAMELASQNPNPQQALNEYAIAGENLEFAANRILGKPLMAGRDPGIEDADITSAVEGKGKTKTFYGKTTLFAEEMVDEEMQEELNYALLVADFMKNSPNMSPEEASREASILFDQKPESFWLTETDLREVFGNKVVQSSDNGWGTDLKVGTGIIGKQAAVQGLEAARTVNAGGIAESEPWLYIGTPGNPNPVVMPASAVNKALGVTDWEDGSTRGGWEKIGNRTEWVIRALEDVTLPKWWFSEKTNRWLTPKQAEEHGQDYRWLADNGYSLEDVNALSGWKKFTAGDGRVWYVDPQDGHLHADAPPYSAGILGPGANISDYVDNSGNLDIEAYRLPASTAAGVIAYVGEGVSLREAQRLTEAIIENPADPRINLALFHARDDKNVASFEPLSAESVAGMYWSEADAMAQISWQHRAEGDRARTAALDERAMLKSRLELRRRAEVQSWIERKIGDARAQREFNRYNPDTNIREFAQEQIALGAQAAGIRLGRMPKGVEDTRTDREDFEIPSVERKFKPVDLAKPSVPADVSLRTPQAPTVDIPRPRLGRDGRVGAGDSRRIGTNIREY